MILFDLSWLCNAKKKQHLCCASLKKAFAIAPRLLQEGRGYFMLNAERHKGKDTRLISLVAVSGTRVTKLPSSLSLHYKSNKSMSSPPGFEQRAVDTSICLCALLDEIVKETSEHAFWRAVIDQFFNGLSQAHGAEVFQGSHP